MNCAGSTLRGERSVTERKLTAILSTDIKGYIDPLHPKYIDAITTVDATELRGYMNHICDLHMDNIPVIVVSSVYYVWGASSRLDNVPWTSTNAYVYRGWGRSLYYEQNYIRQ